VLRYWNAWFCRGFELQGTNLSIIASSRRGGQLSPPLGVRAIAARPRLRLTARAVVLNLPNILMMGASIVAVWNVRGYSVLVVLLALQSLLSSIASCVLGVPELLVSLPSVEDRTAPSTTTPDAAQARCPNMPLKTDGRASS
jgi:hypothetical protein